MNPCTCCEGSGIRKGETCPCCEGSGEADGRSHAFIGRFEELTDAQIEAARRGDGFRPRKVRPAGWLKAAIKDGSVRDPSPLPEEDNS